VGQLRNCMVAVLIDCGAAHSTKVVDNLKLPVTKTSSYFAEAGDGHKVLCSGVCKQFSWNYMVLKCSKISIFSDWELQMWFWDWNGWLLYEILSHKFQLLLWNIILIMHLDNMQHNIILHTLVLQWLKKKPLIQQI